jgi:hypothetical protein
MAYVEEEFSRDTPQAPSDSFLFLAFDILIPPHTSGQHSSEGEFTLEMENCLVEEEIPTAGQDEEAQPVIDCQPTAASVLETPRIFHFSKDHLQLIFVMRQDATDQIHRQTILCHRLKALFDSPSSKKVKRRCSTCCQPYVFSPQPPNGDNNPGLPTV